VIADSLWARTPETKDMIIPEFYGHVRYLIKHPEASLCLDDAYRTFATPVQKAALLREFYGAEFAIFKSTDETATPSLGDLLTASPEKRAPIMRSLFELIRDLVQKHMHGFTILHDAMLEYFENAKAGSEEVTEFLALAFEDDGAVLRNLAFTKSGAKVSCLALAYGSAKVHYMNSHYLTPGS